MVTSFFLSFFLSFLFWLVCYKYTFHDSQKLEKRAKISLLGIFTNFLAIDADATDRHTAESITLVTKIGIYTTISLVEKMPTSRDTSSSKWDVVDGKLKIYPFSYF